MKVPAIMAGGTTSRWWGRIKPGGEVSYFGGKSGRRESEINDSAWEVAEILLLLSAVVCLAIMGWAFYEVRFETVMAEVVPPDEAKASVRAIPGAGGGYPVERAQYADEALSLAFQRMNAWSEDYAGRTMLSPFGTVPRPKNKPRCGLSGPYGARCIAVWSSYDGGNIVARVACPTWWGGPPCREISIQHISLRRILENSKATGGNQ